MAKTVWSTAPQRRSNWLLFDGSVEQGPMVESTSSQRRWRVAGTTDSVTIDRLPGTIQRHMHARAHRAGTRVWMELIDNERTERMLHSDAAEHRLGDYGVIDFDVTPDFKLGTNHVMPIVFEFAHPTYPIRAMLWVTLGIDRYGSSFVASSVTYRVGDPDDLSSQKIKRYTSDEGWASAVPKDITWKLERENFGSNPRKAVASFLGLLQHAKNVATIDVPDGREWGNRLELHFTRTNFTADFYRTALDVVQSGPAMKRLAAHLNGIRQELTNLGLVVRDKDGFNLNTLLNGGLSELQVQIVPQEVKDTDNNGVDSVHRVHLDLAHGLFMVSCSRHNLEEIAHSWDVAKFKAELAGESDVLLAYAEAYNNPAEQKRLRKIATERKIVLPK